MALLTKLVITAVGVASFGPPRSGRVRSGALRRSATVEKPLVEVVEAVEADRCPGLEENEVFACDDTVAFWREFQREAPSPAVENLQQAAALAGEGLSSGGARAVAYWASHAARTAYFVGNAVLGTTAFNVNQRLGGGEGGGSPFQAASFGSGAGGLGVDAAIASRLVLEAVLVYDRDWKAVEAGKLKMPWDMEVHNI